MQLPVHSHPRPRLCRPLAVFEVNLHRPTKTQPVTQLASCTNQVLKIAPRKERERERESARARAQHTVWIHRFNAVSYSYSCPSSVSKINLSSSFENEMRGSLSNSVGSCGKLLIGALPSSGGWSVISCSQGGLGGMVRFVFSSRVSILVGWGCVGVVAICWRETVLVCGVRSEALREFSDDGRSSRCGLWLAACGLSTSYGRTRQIRVNLMSYQQLCSKKVE